MHKHTRHDRTRGFTLIELLDAEVDETRDPRDSED